jgi:3-deoxy-D-manno-octulosonic-acid transferase
LEPMAARVPTCFGLKNSRHVLAAEAVRNSAAAGVADESELFKLLTAWLEGPDSAKKTADSGFSFAHRDQDAVRASIAALQNVLPPITAAKMI